MRILYRNTEVAYTDRGKGTAVVFLHGFLENRSMWEPYTEALSGRYRTITVDFPGHGQTDPVGYVLSMEDAADVVHAVLEALKIRKAIFVGHSMGGYVSLAFAEHYPEKIKGIILVNSTARADSDEKKENRDRAIRAVKNDRNAFVRLSIGNLFSEENREKFAPEIESIRQQAIQMPLQGIVAALEGMKIRKDREVLLHFGPYPIALVLGEKDPVLPFDEAITQAEDTRVQTVVFPHGHMSPVENRDELLAFIQKFVKSI